MPAWWAWAPACLLLALVQVLWAGYQLGVGNQTIQIAFLKKLYDPRLYAGDLMVNQTLPSYPSLFYAVLSRLLSVLDVAQLYLLLHLLTAGAMMAAVAGLSRAVFRNHWAALLAMLLFLAGHQQALAGEILYSTGFTHTWAVLPLSLAALGLLFGGYTIGACALAGLAFNFHALEAGYLSVMLVLAALASWRQIGWKRLLAGLGVLVVAASPALWMLLQSRPHFDEAWLRLVHIRSSDHSFPSSWWQAGNTDIPRFLLVVSLGALALSFPGSRTQVRKLMFVGLGAVVLFVIGYVFTEWWPSPTVVRAQLFRSSRLIVALALIAAAHGIVGALSLLRDRTQRLPRWRTALEVASAVVTCGALALPAWSSLLPLALLLAVVVALVNRRLGWHQAVLAGITLLVCLEAWRSLHFTIPGLSEKFPWRSLLEVQLPAAGGVAMIAAAAAVWLAASGRWPRWVRMAGAGLGLALVAAAAPGPFVRWLGQPAAEDGWIGIQQWARRHTNVNAVFLTPAQQGGFRIHSDRAVVGEWRDGTQLYFSAAYAGPWWERMQALQPGLVANEQGVLLSRGGTLARLNDDQLIDLAKRMSAQYVVLPAPKGESEERRLELAYRSGGWCAYHPRILTRRPNPNEDQLLAHERFLREVVGPNIERHRKSNARVQVVDAAGRPAFDLPYRITQVNSSFGFGCSLPFFVAPKGRSLMDFAPPPVDPRELERFLDVFNCSLVPFSGKWMYLEPVQGQRRYEDLDRYIDFCHEHGIRVEFHFLSGYQPAWLKTKLRAEQARLFLAHARDLVQRYGGKVWSWQVVNEKIAIDQSPPVFAEIRRLQPHAPLGISDCARFFSPREGPERDRDMLRGLEEIKWLKGQGVKVDYFGFHGHRPMGLWPDAREMYEALDAFAREGVRLHVTETGVPLGARIEGPVHAGVWNPQNQAAFYEELFTVCFSHPAVDSVNLFGMGPQTWIRGAGLLDDQYRPKPAFDALKRLLTDKWRTRLSGSLPLDGAVAFRGFQGDYELSVSLPSGKTAETRFSLEHGRDLNLRFVLDAEAGSLAVGEAR